MPKTTDERVTDGTPEAFVSGIKDAFQHLYDFAYLERHLLAEMYHRTAEGNSETCGQILRRRLLETLETLNPGRGIPMHAPQARPYHVLHLTYVEGLTVQESARELNISIRQAFRDLRAGENDVAQLMWSQLPDSVLVSTDSTGYHTVHDELQHLRLRPTSIDVRELIDQTLSPIKKLAKYKGVQVVRSMPKTRVPIIVDISVARQVLISLLSQVLRSASSDRVLVELSTSEGPPQVVISYRVAPSEHHPELPGNAVTQLLAHLGWDLQITDPGSGARQILTVSTSSHTSDLVVVDDNEAFVEMIRRYLSDQPCHVVAAKNGQQGLQLAQRASPDAILLDIMMPGMDGWEFLQRLHANQRTAEIPVIICTIIGDSELAYALGASVVLPKPLSREKLLAGLREIEIL
jgi:CheY-like chemotaxis protein